MEFENIAGFVQTFHIGAYIYKKIVLDAKNNQFEHQIYSNFSLLDVRKEYTYSIIAI